MITEFTELVELPSLMLLDLSRQRRELLNLPLSLASAFPSLTTLDLRHSYVRNRSTLFLILLLTDTYLRFPEVVFQFPSLTELHLSCCAVNELPPQISVLTNLHSLLLDVDSNVPGGGGGGKSSFNFSAWRAERSHRPPVIILSHLPDELGLLCNSLTHLDLTNQVSIPLLQLPVLICASSILAAWALCHR